MRRLIDIQLSLQAWLAGKPGARAIFRLLVAAALGVLAAYGSLLFRAMIAFINKLAFPNGASLAQLAATPWWALVLAPAVGGLIVGPLVELLAPEARGHGVPEVKLACTRFGGRIRARVAVVKTTASAVCIGTGGSVGREGPIVQIAASLGSAVGRLAGLRGPYLVDFVAAGAAAGIAATFNAPIAGVMFAIEIILGRGTPRHLSPMVVAAVVATVVVHHHIGSSPAFVVPPYTLNSGFEVILYALLGLLAAVVGMTFTRLVYWVEDLWAMLPGSRLPRAAIGGALVGLMAMQFPEVLGVGYEHIEKTLAAEVNASLTQLTVEGHLLLLLVAKSLATSITVGSGGSGGLFAPSLFLGSCLGGAFGGAAMRWGPAGWVNDPRGYALVSMGGVVGATTHAPLTAILIVFELCNHHSVILPLMMCTMLSTTASMAMLRESIYTLKLVRRGEQLASGSPDGHVRATSVVELMQASPPRVVESAPIDLVAERAREEHTHFVYVTDHKRHLLGVIDMDEVASHIGDSASKRRELRARNLMHAAEHVNTTDDVNRCLTLLENRRLGELPVVDEEGKLVGCVTRVELFAYYTDEVLRRESVLSLTSDSGRRVTQEHIALGATEQKAKLIVPASVAGKTLCDLDIRRRFSVNVYAVQRSDEPSRVPDPNRPLEQGDTLIVVGSKAAVELLRRALAAGGGDGSSGGGGDEQAGDFDGAG
ncbi:MAG: chloride channel protein [Myxococcales bacterium]|nr:chloride channel protein [Myxococcales bacterium]